MVAGEQKEQAPRISVVIPAFNEEASIGEIVRRICALNCGWEVIVVDDGSGDRTALVAENAGARVIRHPYNRGNGAAIKSGVRNCSGDWIVFLDGDGQHPPEEIPRLLQYIRQYDMVVGARIRNPRILDLRSFGNAFLNWFAGFLSGEEIMDLTSGFRAIRRDIMMDFLHILPNRYSYPTTMTLALMKCGYFVHYEPVEWMRLRKTGKSNIKPVQDGFRFLSIILRMTMLFNPLKIFMPIGLMFISAGFVFGVMQVIYRGGLFGGTLILFISGLFTLLFGFFADQVSSLRIELSQNRHNSKGDKSGISVSEEDKSGH